jgi:mRNA-degrading endonuclease toxin of MazEF toxin-antitoxin module
MKSGQSIWTQHKDTDDTKTRPCIVLSNDIVNKKLGLSIVVPITGTAHYLKSGKLSPAMVEILSPEGGCVDTFEQAKSAVETGAFHAAEPGPYRLLAVYQIPPPFS